MNSCNTCQSPLTGDVPGHCSSCGSHGRISARELVGWLMDDVTDMTPAARLPNPLDWPGYDELRDRAATAAGSDESVIVVRGCITGSDVEVVVVAWEFGFLGGSMGGDAGIRIAAGFDAAREAGLPLLLAPSTGGARMQEGMGSLVQMASSTVASRRHANAGLLQVTLLRDPTTGGVFASHANLADVIIAEPGATLGFAGPRVAETMTGGRLPSGSHTSRGARAAGLIDEVVARPDLPVVLAGLLGWPTKTSGHDGAATHPATHPATRPATRAATGPATAAPKSSPLTVSTASGDDPPGDGSAWRQVQAARDPGRLRAPAFLAALDVVFELHGDRSGSDDPSIRPVLARLDDRPVLVVAMDPTINPNPRPGGFRKAWRGLRLASRLGVPVVTLIDTPGADASASSEAAGIAHHIATSLVEVLAVSSPVVSVVIGEGGSGGALALATGDRVLIQEHAIFSVIAPEGAAAILHRDPSRAQEVAELLDPTATRLLALGVADEVIPEPPGQEVATVWAAVARNLDLLAHVDPATRAQRWLRPLESAP